MNNNLAEHARTELILIGKTPGEISAIVDILQGFSDLAAFGETPMEALPNITSLLYFKNLSELTDDPNEWADISSAAGRSSQLWQSTRNAEAFSTDGGKTYYTLSERDMDPSSLHLSKESGS